MAGRNKKSVPANAADRKILGTLTKSERSPIGAFDLYEDSGLLEAFVDGVGQMLAGPHVCRLLLHKIEGVDNTSSPLVEQRKSVISLVIPTANLIQMCQFIMKNLHDNADLLVKSLNDSSALLIKLKQENSEGELKQMLAQAEK